MSEFINGKPAAPGHYWLKIRNTDSNPVPGNHESGEYCWVCSCHPGIYHSLSDRTSRNIELGYQEISGFVLLPDPGVSL